MVERETQVHHMADRNSIILGYNRPLHYCIHTQNARVRLVNNGYRYNCTKDTRIIHDKGAALHILNGELIRTSTLCDLAYASRQASQGVLIRIMNDRHNQAN